MLKQPARISVSDLRSSHTLCLPLLRIPLTRHHFSKRFYGIDKTSKFDS